MGARICLLYDGFFSFAVVRQVFLLFILLCYIDGYVVHIDTTDIRAQTAELQKIGVNVNQIARRLNSMGPLYAQDVADIKGALTQIWQLQRYILSSQR